MPGWDAAEAGIDVTAPNAARMYDYGLGGKENYAADREAVHRLIVINPGITSAMRANRAFLGRVVRYAAEAGIRQFLDIGSGLPTQQNVHQIAHEHAPGARVVYCDVDPVVVAHTQALLAGTDNAWVIQHDLRRPREILRDPLVRTVLDFRQPIAILLNAVLHFLPDDAQPARVLQELARVLSPGSMLAISHATWEWQPDRHEQFELAREVFEEASAAFTWRSGAEVAGWMAGEEMEIIDPGIVPISEWRADNPAQTSERGVFGLVAVRRPGGEARAGG
jgi:O-methyltransferase involved in polyketide biosynthesis